MKILFLISALILSAGFFSGDFAHANSRKESRLVERSNDPDTTAGCKDCLEVKKAIREAHLSSGRTHRGGTRIGNRSTQFSERIHMKMKRIFSHRKKARTSYEICFGWQ